MARIMEFLRSQSTKQLYIGSVILGFILFGISGSGEQVALANIGSLFIMGPLIHYLYRRMTTKADRQTNGAIVTNPDPEARQFRIGRTVYDYDELIAYELVESAGADQTILTKGGVSVGRAVVGGALFGGLGAAVGAVSGKKHSFATSHPYADRLYIRLVLNDPAHPHEMIHFLKKKTDKGSKQYRKALDQAQQALSTLDFIAHQNK